MLCLNHPQGMLKLHGLLREFLWSRQIKFISKEKILLFLFFRVSVNLDDTQSKTTKTWYIYMRYARRFPVTFLCCISTMRGIALTTLLLCIQLFLFFRVRVNLDDIYPIYGYIHAVCTQVFCKFSMLYFCKFSMLYCIATTTLLCIQLMDIIYRWQCSLCTQIMKMQYSTHIMRSM